MTKRPTAIVQARMASTRLPAKIFKELGGKPVLFRVVERLRMTRLIGGICIATTTNASDDKVAAFADEIGADCFRGSELDVLARFQGAAAHVSAESIVRITSDCPLIDPDIVDLVVEAFLGNDAAYASNTVERTYPIGMDTEVFSRAALEEAAANATRPEEREHVTPYFYRHPDKFNVINIAAPAALRDPFLRLTLDTPEDFELLSRIYAALAPDAPNFRLQDVLAFLRQNEGLRALNDHVPHNWLKPVGA